MRSILFLTILIGFSSPLCAQSDSSTVSKRKIFYFNSFQAGGLLGKSEQGSALSLSTTHGVRIKRLAFGASVGFDSYLDWKTLPVFGSVSFDFGKIRHNAFFIQFNAGYSTAWGIKKEDWEPNYTVSGGKMISSIIGYRITAKQYSLYISAGYKFQQVHYSYNPTPWLSSSQSKISIEENMNRMVVQIGFGLH